jgi:hypothetical protein
MWLVVEEWFCHLATPGAWLACIQLLLDGVSFIAVPASPMASPKGQLSRISDILPGLAAL